MDSNETEFSAAIEEIEGWGDSEPTTSTVSDGDFIEIEVPSEKELAEKGKTHISRELKVEKKQIGKYKRLLRKQLRNFQYPIAIVDVHKSEEYMIYLSSALAIFLGKKPLNVLKKKKRQLERLSLKYNRLGKKIKKDLSYKDPRLLLSSLSLGNKVRAAELYFGCAEYTSDNVKLVEDQILSFGGKTYTK